MLRLFAADAWLSAVSSRHRRHSQSRPSCGILQLFQVYDALIVWMTARWYQVPGA